MDTQFCLWALCVEENKVEILECLAHKGAGAKLIH